MMDHLPALLAALLSAPIWSLIMHAWDRHQQTKQAQIKADSHRGDKDREATGRILADERAEHRECREQVHALSVEVGELRGAVAACEDKHDQSQREVSRLEAVIEGLRDLILSLSDRVTQHERASERPPHLETAE